MASIISYLTFNGNCAEAMTFYKKCLGGKLTFQTVGESPMAGKMPGKMKSSIMHSMLQNDTLVLMASDMTEQAGLKKGNNISLLLDCSSEAEMQDRYKKLSSGGGKQTHPIEPTFWGALFGGLTDKFGNHWLLNFQSKQNN